MALRLDAINRFPVKSCRGEALEAALVEPWGLAGDRRWLLVDEDGDQRTAREHPRLLLVDPTVHPDGGLTFAAPGVEALTVPPPVAGPLVDVRVWRTTIAATPAYDGPWFTELLGASTRLVYLDDPTRRAVDAAFGQAGDRVSFADSHPLLLTTTASLDRLNDLIAESGGLDVDPLPMIRFRPNVVVRGGEAWDEDGWRRLRIGAVGFRAVKGCERCVMTTIDPVTAARGKEPITTLARHRRWDGGTWFGMNLVPDTPGATVRLGDEVEILEAVPAPDGPPR